MNSFSTSFCDKGHLVCELCSYTFPILLILTDNEKYVGLAHFKPTFFNGKEAKDSKEALCNQ